jgi:putative transposase
LRQQLAILQREQPRPKLHYGDRLFWIFLMKIWKKWRTALVIVQPATVVSWHRRRFKQYWWRLSQKKGPGRPPVCAELRKLVRTMAAANITWGAPRIHGELLKLGFEISDRTVSRLMPRRRKQPSQTWKSFLSNHVGHLVSIDFFTVPTIQLRVLFVFVVLAHERRRVLHFNVTEHPTAEWTAQQMIEAFPDDCAPKYLIRDRDGVYGNHFRNRVAGLGIQEVLTAAQSPWQNSCAERLIGSIRPECLNHVIVLGERHLRWMLKRYIRYYLESRMHLSLQKDSPIFKIAAECWRDHRDSTSWWSASSLRTPSCITGFLSCRQQTPQCRAQPASHPKQSRHRACLHKSMKHSSNISWQHNSSRCGCSAPHPRFGSGGYWRRTGEELLLETAGLATDWKGQFVLYSRSSQNGSTDIFALSLDGDRTPISVAQTNFDEGNGQFSPDAKWIAFQSNESGRSEIYLQAFPGPGGKSRVSTNGGAQVRAEHPDREL